EATSSGGSATTDSTNGGAGTLTSSATATGGSAGSGGTVGNSSTGGAGGADPGNGGFMVDAGIDHSCAVSHGRHSSWGAAERGRRGVGHPHTRSSPARVGSLVSWLQVTTGGDHSCALREDGTVWCFGANDTGQLGSPGVNDVLSPIAVTLPSPAVALTSES